MGSHAAPHHHKRILVTASEPPARGRRPPGTAASRRGTRPADACRTTATHLPRGDCGPFWQVLAEDFNGGRLPLGAFSDWEHAVDTSAAHCGGLKGKYRDNWWAYPTG
jgi:hypothetical protein